MAMIIKLALLLAVSIADAQQLEQLKSSPVASNSINLLRKTDLPSIPVPDSAFRLSTGDQLRLRWWGLGSQDIDLVVDTRGDIVLPDIGRVSTRGKVFKVLRDSIESLIRKRTKADLIDLQIIKIVPAQIQVAGNLRHPGIYEIPAGTRLSIALASAGIDVPDQIYQIESAPAAWMPQKFQEASFRRILVLRGGKDSAWCDLIRARRTGNALEDPPLFFGDRVILVPRGKIIQVTGGAKFQGGMEIIPGESLNKFLEAIGEDAHAQVSIESDGKKLRTETLDSSTTIVRFPSKSFSNNVNHVWVLGNVQSPGAYSLNPPATAKQLISEAGGIIGGDDSGLVVTIKRDWSNLTPARERSTIDATQSPEVRAALFSYLAHTRGTYGDLNNILQPGDTVLVYPIEPVVWVGGEVRNPGFVAWKKGMDLDFFIQEAGGYADRPWISRIKVYDLQTGQPRAGKPQNIRPGTAIIVPENRFITPEQWVGIIVSVGSFALTATALVVTLSKN